MFEGQSVAANGSETSSSVSLSTDTTLSLQIQGDSDSTNLSFIVEAKVDSSDEWAELDGSNVLTSNGNDLRNLDLTVADSNNIILQYDCLDLERLRLKVKENAGNNPTIDAVVSKSVHQ